jgi:hypothetical protein
MTVEAEEMKRIADFAKQMGSDQDYGFGAALHDVYGTSPDKPFEVARSLFLADLRALLAKVEKLEGALRPFAERWDATFGGERADNCSDNELFDHLDPADFRAARAALGPSS